MKNNWITFILLLTVLASCETTKPKSVTTPSKVDSLLSVMTLEEKLGQMTQMCFSTITLDGTKDLNLNAELFKESILKYHVGSFLSGTGPKKKWTDFISSMQKIAVEESRLGIPLIIGIDHVHGANYVDEGTILPHNLTLSCSFDPEVMKAGAIVTAKETAPLGLQWNFAPVLDVGKNSTWPRLYETFGEDPLVCGVMGSAFAKAYQDCEAILPLKLAACAKHFVGYSDPKSGWDRTAADIPDQVLYEYFLPSFQMAFDADIQTVMVNSGEVNGEAVHGSSFYLNEILRKRMGFEGVVLTDIKDIQKLVDMHGVATNYEEAVLLALDAGIDMTMSCNHFEFLPTVKRLVSEGKITEARIDQSVRRILALKMELGLFENPYPTGDLQDVIGSPAHHQVAVEAAEQSIVLLKNNDVLPLKFADAAAVGGFAADSRKMLNGAWTLEWLGADEDRQKQSTPTLYQALSSKNKHTSLWEEKTPPTDAKIIILTIGEKPYSEFKGNVNDHGLSAEDKAIIDRADKLGIPIVAIIIAGRPVILGEYEQKLDAILFTGYPGEGGAQALSNILYGEVNPTGKLSFTYPSGQGHHHPYYHKKSEYRYSKAAELQPLYSFGHGLGYTRFAYSKLTLSDTIITSAESKITASVTVTNTGEMDSKETVLWYIEDEVGQVTRPVKQLKKFEKKMVKSGESVIFSLQFEPKNDLSYPDKNGESILEDGYFQLMIGGEKIRFKLTQK